MMSSKLRSLGRVVWLLLVFSVLAFGGTLACLFLLRS